MQSSAVNLPKVGTQLREINTKTHTQPIKSVQWVAPSSLKTTQKKVAILLATFQGQRFLEEQLNSYLEQSHQNWELWVSDDGSNDQTVTVLNDFKSRLPNKQMSIHHGPQEGFAANFLSLTCHADIQADYYAYSDQDDVWEKERLTKAVSWLGGISEDVPALYTSRTLLVDANNQPIGQSALFRKPASFPNALVQTIGGANTMVFNNAARKLIAKVSLTLDIVSHDWWAYLIVEGVGGKVFYDSAPQVRYRQHKNNLVGTNATLRGKLRRLRMLWNGDFIHRNELNIRALESVEEILTPENRQLLHMFKEARQSSFIKRLILLKKTGIYRQTFLGNLGLIVAALFRKI